MGGGDVDHGVEGIRREFNRLSIQPQATTDEEQFDYPFFIEEQTMTQLFDPFVNNSLARYLEDTRYARRVSVGGLPPSANEQTVAIFFNQAMAAIGGNTAGPGDAVVDVDMIHDRGFALVEMRLTEEASNAMALDGILFEGVPLKIRRPPGYKPSEAAALGPSMPSRYLNLAAVGLTPGSVEGLKGPDRICVSGLPKYLTEAQVRELLESFGPLRGFDLVKDWGTGDSMGHAYCVYQNSSVTDIACASLNGMRLHDNTLTVGRAKQRASQHQPEVETILLGLMAEQQAQLQQVMFGLVPTPTKVVCLLQVLTADELKHDKDYEEIMEHMRLEACRYGNLVKVVIPRPDSSGQLVDGVGKVFFEYADIDSAIKAKTAFREWKFDGNPVFSVYYPEIKFANLEFDG